MADDHSLTPDPWPLSPDRWVAPSAHNLAEVFAGTAERGGFRTAKWDDAWAADLQSPEPIANSVTLRAPLTAGAAPELTARLDDFFGQGKGAGWIIWSAWPTPDLAQLGYTAIGEPPLMVRPPGGAPLPTPNGLRIVKARDAAALADFERVLIDGYPLPTLQPARAGSTFGAAALGGPTRFFVGYEEERPVTVAGACIDSGVVGIYFVATLAEARGRNRRRRTRRSNPAGGAAIKRSRPAGLRAPRLPHRQPLHPLAARQRTEVSGYRNGGALITDHQALPTIHYPRSLRIGLASVPNAPTVEERLAMVERMLAEAAAREVAIVCFPEAYIPGLRGFDFPVPPPDQARQQAALERICAAAKRHGVAVVMGMEWETANGTHNAAVVIGRDGELCGWQVKNQIPPEEEPHYVPDGQRRLFEIDGVPFGIAICHEGWRYPETVRWATTRGAKLVFHPQLTGSDLTGPTLTRWGDPAAPYYEKAMIARAVENVIYFASVNYAFRFQESATSLIAPDGACRAHVLYGQERLLVCDLDLTQATGLYAKRYNPALYPD